MSEEIVKAAERIEALAWADLFDATPELRDELGLEVAALDQARVVSGRRLDSLMFNRAIGFASDQPQAVKFAIDHFAKRGIDRYLLHVRTTTHDAEFEALLEQNRIERYRRAWDKFVRGAEPPPTVATELSIREARPDDAERVARLLASAFDTGENEGRLFVAAIGRKGWHTFVATDAEDRPVALGSLFANAELGYLGFAATDPAFRRRGAQGALMVRRIERALELGCRFTITETGEPVPGEKSPSRDNMLRLGFRCAYRRENYVPVGTRWIR
jgi:GNAT superfamily N-acetyltransferase